jgi:hypothetical protein
MLSNKIDQRKTNHPSYSFPAETGRSVANNEDQVTNVSTAKRTVTVSAQPDLEAILVKFEADYREAHPFRCAVRRLVINPVSDLLDRIAPARVQRRRERVDAILAHFGVVLANGTVTQ